MKPKAARSAAVRAKNGDVSAQLELMGKWTQKVLSGDKSLTLGEKLMLPLVVAIIVVLAMGVSWLLSSQARWNELSCLMPFSANLLANDGS